MKNLKEKKGISLIVLVITIIVMIILATAIILSLSNSGIIGKASKAKNDSDTANLKEYVNILEAEYELMSETERGGKTSIEYVNEKLAEKGYKRMLNNDGILLTESATSAVSAGIQLGDEVTGYTLDSSKSSYTTSGKESTESQTVEQTAFETWRYVGISDDGELLIAPVMIENSKKITLEGAGGIEFGPSELDDVCNALYSTDKGKARSINLKDIYNLLGLPGYESLESFGDYVSRMGYRLSDMIFHRL